MNSILPAPLSNENSKQNLVDNLIKCLDKEFAKFEAVAKNCDRYTVVDVKLPVRVIEMYYKIFKMCSNNTFLRQNVDSVELFIKIFICMRSHFKTQCNCDLDIVVSDDDDADNYDPFLCDETDPMKRFLHYITQEEVERRDDGKESLLKELKHASDWLLEHADYFICDLCNSKNINPMDMLGHAKTDTHIKNLDAFKANELFVAFPNLKYETFGCKTCKSEYSTFNSLVKHFSKPQHLDGKKNYLSGNVQSIAESSKSSKKENKPNPSTGSTSEMMTFKAKKTNNDSSKSNTIANNLYNGTNKTPASLPIIKPIPGKSGKSIHPTDNVVSTKAKWKSTTDVTPKTTKSKCNNVSTKSQSKNTAVAATTASSTKPSDTVSTKPTVESTPSGTSAANKPTSAVPAESKRSYNSKFIVLKDSVSKYCQICAQNLPDEGTVLAHVRGPDHVKMVSTFETNQEYVKMSSCGSNFFCVMCGAKCSTIHELACHFNGKEHRDWLNSLSKLFFARAPAPTKPAQKPSAKHILNSAKLPDTDRKFLCQKASRVQCIICGGSFTAIDDLLDHVNDKKHAANVLNFVKHEQYVRLPSDKVASFNCLKCTAVFDSFGTILSHCKKHVDSTPKSKPIEPFKLSKSDEKFISKIKSEKSSRCNLCDKELPTEAALISHTGSLNHVKNYNTLTKNEAYCVAGKTSCSLCEHSCHDLTSLVKHFKSDTHRKTVVKGKKAKNQTLIHIPSYSKPKLEKIDVASVPQKSPKQTPKKDKKHEDLPTLKSRLQLFSMSYTNFEEITFEQFPMKKPDNSYVIAKNDVFYCRICDSDLPAEMVAAHMNGATHRINVEVFELLQRHVLSTDDSVQCTSCKLSFDHVHQLVKHFREKIHAKPTPAEEEKPSEPDPVFDLTSTDLAKKFDSSVALHAKEFKPEKASISPKRVTIPKYERKHIFRLTKSTIQCNFCNVKLSDNEALTAHIDNLNHKRNSTVYLENETLIRQLDSVGSTFECLACAFSGNLNKVIKHCKKRQHAAAKGYEAAVSEDDEIPDEDADVDTTISEFDLKCITMKNGIVRCRICHSKLTGEKNLLDHMGSVNHKQSSIIYKANEPFIEQFDELGYSYKCTVCEVIFTRVDTMIRHFTEAPGHAQQTTNVDVNNGHHLPPADIATVDVRTYNFECMLCTTTSCGFADLSRHCRSVQHDVLKNIIQNEQNEIPYNITITDYQYHCNACNIRLLNKAVMEKHQKKKFHEESIAFYLADRRNGECRPNVIEIVGYEYLCNLCWFPMYSAAELTVHEQSYMHKSGKNFDDVWRFNEKHLIMCENMYKVGCKLCEKTIGIERFIKHCTSRDHRMKFIANHVEESAQDQHIVWRNATQYCTLCDCKLINNHNLVNHVNSEKHKLKLLQN